MPPKKAAQKPAAKKPEMIVAKDPVLGVIAVPKDEAVGKMWVKPDDTLKPAMTSDPAYYAASLLLGLAPVFGIFYTVSEFSSAIGACFPARPFISIRFRTDFRLENGPYQRRTAK